MKTNYVLIDLENIQPEDLAVLAEENYRVLVFVGAQQNRISFSLAYDLQQMGDRAKYIKISGSGSNALDFHVAYYIGQISAQDPNASFQIIARDTGYDPLIKHLTSLNVRVSRLKSITGNRQVANAKSNVLGDRLKLLLERLKKLKGSLPSTLKSLQSSINSTFQKQLSQDEIEHLVREMMHMKWISLSGTKLSYHLPMNQMLMPANA